ncbi:MAG: 30S ribosomal protein THX [Burkholderiaceae bacterium]|nr:30S ribosomal protein THX [Burkholderiaceae bacterium]
MGKGDLRTRRGKIYNGSHGKKRPGRLKKAAAPVTRTHAAPVRSGRAR